MPENENRRDPWGSAAVACASYCRSAWQVESLAGQRAAIPGSSNKDQEQDQQQIHKRGGEPNVHGPHANGGASTSSTWPGGWAARHPVG